MLVVAPPEERSTELARLKSWDSGEKLSRKRLALGSKYSTQVEPLVKLLPGYPGPRVPKMLAMFPVSEIESPKK